MNVESEEAIDKREETIIWKRKKKTLKPIQKKEREKEKIYKDNTEKAGERGIRRENVPET